MQGKPGLHFLPSVEAYFDDKGHFVAIRCVCLLQMQYLTPFLLATLSILQDSVNFIVTSGMSKFLALTGL